MDYEGLLELVTKRRSIRRFKSDPIPDEYVEKIIDVARWAPSGFNTQPWEFVVVKKQEFKDNIVQRIDQAWAQIPRDTNDKTRHSRMEISSRPMNYSNAPVFIILFGDVRTRVGLPVTARTDERFPKVFLSSLASAFLYMHLAVTALGLASQWVSAISFPSVHHFVKDLLGIPEELKAYDMMAVGYPAVKSRPKLVRPVKKMVHYDYCGKEDFRTDEDVNDYARRTRTWTIATIRREADKTSSP